ncbi:hypothetical protein SAMN05216276_101564 [Streptosporangium subroseum]|uniref:Uncharacterized protein n=2 Tax=Streptosporangium subroseum TaxID=106412 RepID=A0A239H3I5_9ACTN|nr:hypothetical protein SAMN05216276_101564 [Streptosporangium subroseum]
MPPGPFKLLIGVLLLSVAIRGLKWISGVDPYVRGPFDWAALVTSGLGMALALTVAVEGFRKARRHEYDEPAPGEASDGPRNRLLMSSGAMLVVMAATLSSIFSLLASTDGGDPYTTGPLDWASWASMGLIFVSIFALIAWIAHKGLM